MFILARPVIKVSDSWPQSHLPSSQTPLTEIKRMSLTIYPWLKFPKTGKCGWVALHCSPPVHIVAQLYNIVQNTVTHDDFCWRSFHGRNFSTGNGKGKSFHSTTALFGRWQIMGDQQGFIKGTREVMGGSQEGY